MPDPCDARETQPGPGPGFTLPCRCGAAVERDRLIQALATAHGRSEAAERAAWGLTTTHEGPHTTTVRGPSPHQEGHR